MEVIATNANFADIIKAAEPVMVDFWATWCGPCRMLSPTVDEIATEYDGKATVVKCNVDDCEDIASRYGIRNIPTLLFFKGGEVVDRLVGAVPKGNITAKLDSLLK
jgi:thioredoxin 1